jgi:hypothetical protein
VGIYLFHPFMVYISRWAGDTLKFKERTSIFLDRINRIHWIVGFLSFLKKLRKAQSACGGNRTLTVCIPLFPSLLHCCILGKGLRLRLAEGRPKCLSKIVLKNCPHCFN